MTNRIENSVEDSTGVRHQLPPVEQLVDREKQINQFNELLDRIHRGKMITSSVFEWYGGPGIGKSALVELLKNECQKKSIAFSWLNFRVYPSTRALGNDPTLLLADIMDEWGVATNGLLTTFENFRTSIVEVDSFVSIYDEFIQNRKKNIETPIWFEPLEDVKIKFVDAIDEYAKGEDGNVNPLVIFFDETEILDAELIYWIEDYIINPLGRAKKVVIVWTARQPWRWRKPQVRHRLRSEKLDVFGDEEVKDHLRVRDVEPDLIEQLFRNVRGVTGGHPFASDVVISEIATWSNITQDIFIHEKANLLGKIFAEFIAGYAFRGLSPEIKATYELLALVRLFDITMIRKLLTVSKSKLFEQWEFEEFSDLLNQLKRTQLLDWDKGYVLEKSLRHLISENLYANDEETYRNINHAAREVYQDWLGRPVDNRGLFIIEDIYHNACLMRVGEDNDIKVVMSKHLDDFRDHINDPVALKNSLDRLAGNMQRDEEICKLVGNSTLLELVQLIENYKPS